MSRREKIRKIIENNRSLIPVRFIDLLEDLVHGFLGIVLFGIGIAAAYFTLVRIFTTKPFFPIGMIQGINDILFIVIILEVMRTVVERFTDGTIQLDKFLVIGVIAAIRHILTVGASMTLETEKTDELFTRSLYELGINTGIVVALVVSIYLSRSLKRNS